MSSLIAVRDVRTDKDADERADCRPDIFRKIPCRDIEIDEELAHGARILLLPHVSWEQTSSLFAAYTVKTIDLSHKTQAPPDCEESGADPPSPPR
jgi:hypothetical protein